MTKIEWTRNPDGTPGQSWNWIVGCTLESPGCTHCYAMRQAARIERMSPDLEHYVGLTKASKAGPVWTGKIADAGWRKLTEPIRRTKPTTWFVNSMADLFHPGVSVDKIAKTFAVMLLTPRHTYQVLTKRAARMREIVSAPDFVDDVLNAATWLMDRQPVSEAGIEAYRALRDAAPGAWPLPNVWLGVSAEDQTRADERVPDLLATPAAVRFVSAEPLLGPIDFNKIDIAAWLRRYRPDSDIGLNAYDPDMRFPLLSPFEHFGSGASYPGLDWIIVGGESGPSARPMQVPWARSIVQQCKAAGVACFVKQLGADPIWEDGAFLNLAHRKGADMAEWPCDLRVREVPDAAA